MRKLSIIAVCFLLATVSIATASTISIEKTQASFLAQNGTFDGTIGYHVNGNWTAIGTINGTYQQRLRGYRFDGTWTLQGQNQTFVGTMRGVFRRHILLGRVTAEGYERTLPIIGFIGFKEGNFVGRFMAPVGPALYFKGTYT
ncbi:MAG: hypothetical protein QHH19_02925 [Candidatus Thermoplasmatota archaeon]|jgi:hypothetical protein|nr:hypothetical protein [Candidatus Thermoplasmatota archaeon]